MITIYYTLCIKQAYPANHPSSSRPRFTDKLFSRGTSSHYMTNTGTNYGKKGKHAFVGLPGTHEYRNKKRCTDPVLVQLCVYAVLHPTILLSGRLVVAGYDDTDYPLVLVVIAVGRQALNMELIDILPGRQACSE